MKRTLTMAMVAIVSFMLGVACMYLSARGSKPLASDGWIAVTIANYPIGYALDYPIGTAPTPKANGVAGRVKFLVRDNGIQLGYLLKMPLDPVPTKSLPLKDQQETKLPDGSSYGPPDQLHLEGQFDFVLKDIDGFVLQKLSAPEQNLTAGSENETQGTAEGIVSASVSERTKQVTVSFLVKSCYPCR